MSDEIIEVPTHVLIRRLRGEIEDNLATLSLSIGMGELFQAQEMADRIKHLLGVLDALTEEEGGIYS